MLGLVCLYLIIGIVCAMVFDCGEESILPIIILWPLFGLAIFVCGVQLFCYMCKDAYTVVRHKITGK
jgi:hypothetical protein